MSWYDPERNVSAVVRKEQVLRRLMTAALSGDKVCGPAISTPECGGGEGLRRARELRGDGYVIRVEKHRGTDHYDYRLVS